MIEINLIEYKQLREAKGLSPTTLAKKAGISWGTINRLEERGQTTEKTLKKIADALGRNVRELIKGGVQKEQKPADELEMNAERSPFGIASEKDPFARAVSDLREIFNSGDDTIITAIQAGLYSFKRAVRREAENQELKAKVQSLESRLAAVEEKLKGG